MKLIMSSEGVSAQFNKSLDEIDNYSLVILNEI